MDNKQPEALLRADDLESIGAESSLARAMAAHTIRLLHKENARLHEVNAELVEALQDLLGEVTDGYEPHEVFITQAKAALRKAHGDNNG